MIGFEEAIAIVAAEAEPIAIETTPLARAGGRILAEPVHARLDAPRYDAAAMDGFAVRSDGASHGYDVVGASYPGEPWRDRLAAGQAVRIMTGAEVPADADRVIPFELTERTGDRLHMSERPARTHIRRRGSDIRAGQAVLPAGTRLDPRAILIAAAADVAAVRTWRRPVVSLIAGGDELAPPGTAADLPTAVPDSLSNALLLFARQYDAKPGNAELVRDDAAAIRAKAEHLLAASDVLIMVGGASRGDRDFAKPALTQLGLRLSFATVAMKPGKPVWYGRIGRRHVLGLPGNPTAALTTARLFLAPLLYALTGRSLHDALAWRPRTLTAPAPAGGARESFLCGMSTRDGVTILDRQSASAQLLLARADTLVRIPADAPAYRAGERVDTLKF